MGDTNKTRVFQGVIRAVPTVDLRLVGIVAGRFVSFVVFVKMKKEKKKKKRPRKTKKYTVEAVQYFNFFFFLITSKISSFERLLYGE